MKFTLLGLSILVFSLQSQAQERRWQCTGKDDKALIRLDKTIPCPIGFRAEEIDTQGKVIPHGFDPLANTLSVRCIGISKVVVYGERECLTQKALGWMKGEPVKVNREGFTPEEAVIDSKRRTNLALQKAWENQSNKTNTQKPIFNKTQNINDELADLKDFDTVKPNKAEAKESDCRAWRSSNIIDPTPEKRRYIKENCN